MALPAAGTVSYKGVTFDSYYSSKISARPIQDDAKRTTVYVEYTIEVDAIVAAPAGSVTDDILEDWRERLTTQGGALRYENKGFGVLNVNVGTVRDVAWGPIPELIAAEPVGNDRGWRVQWRVVTRIPECNNARYRNALLAFNYEESWDIDKVGYTTRIIEGYLEIPMTRLTAGSRIVPDRADRYRERIVPAIPLGFERTQSYQESADKRRLDFRFLDKELPLPLPVGVAVADVDFTVRTGLQQGFLQWFASISATIRMARGVIKITALDRWILILRHYLGHLVNSKSSAILQQVEFGDKPFDDQASFSAEVLVNKATIASILNTTRIWVPVEDTSFSRWRTSMSQAWSPRGFAGLEGRPEDDVIVDLCQAPPDTSVSSLRSGLPPSQSRSLSVVPCLFGRILPESSWLDYRLSVRFLEQQSLAVHKPLPEEKTVQAVLRASLSLPPARATVKAPLAARIINITPDEVQATASPDRLLVLAGYGVRIGYRVPVPQLPTAGGITLIEEKRIVYEGIAGAVCGVPINYTVWHITYRVPDAPGVILLPGNPVVGAGPTAGPAGKLTPN